MTLKTTAIDYHHGDVALQGYFAVDDDSSTPKPLVLIGHQWAGHDEFVQQHADRMAQQGYAAFAWDVYGKGVLGSSPEENEKLMTPFVQDRQLLQDRLMAALDTAKELPGVDTTRIAAFGFCFGGLCALDLARAGLPLQGVASFHALLMPNGLEQKEIRARTLLMHGAEDPLAPDDAFLDWKKEFTAAGADWEARVYGHAKHAFAVPGAKNDDIGLEHQATAEQRSTAALDAFLAEVLA